METSSSPWKGRGGGGRGGRNNNYGGRRGGGNGGGRGGGGGRYHRGRGGGRNSNNSNNNNHHHHRRPTPTKQQAQQQQQQQPITSNSHPSTTQAALPNPAIMTPTTTNNSMPPSSSTPNHTNTNTNTTDEEVLIGFMQLLRSGDEGALQLYQSTPPHAFVEAARHYLQKDDDMEKMVNDLMSMTTTSSLTTTTPTATATATATTVKTTHKATSNPKVVPVVNAIPPGTGTTNMTVTEDGTDAKSTATGTASKDSNEKGAAAAAGTNTTSSSKWQPKRRWMRLEEQPGQLLANRSAVEDLDLGPRQSLLATWKLPLEFLRQRMLQKYKTQMMANVTVQDALEHLTVGLFRRGCMDNTSSIISKPVIPSSENQPDYQFQVMESTHMIWGTVPFYTPRTPGNVVLRLYFDDDTADDTLATSPCITVGVTEEATLRFLLSHFKSSSNNNNSNSNNANTISTLYSTAAVLEQLESPAGRAGWGCICESAKVFQHHLQLHQQHLQSKKDSTDKEKDKEKEKEKDSGTSKETNKEKEGSSTSNSKSNSNERKWRDVQAAYSAILKAVITNNHKLLLKRDYMWNCKMEYELWCPLSETFAPILAGKNNRVAKEQYQQTLFGFVPRMHTLSQILIHGNNKKGKSQASAQQSLQMMQRLSTAMHTTYTNSQTNAHQINLKREQVRQAVQALIQNIFPPNTHVVIFGSSANGFGSPSSDLDMCLQLPTNATNETIDPDAMTQLATVLEANGMTNVDSSRLTARIPVLKFYYQNMECDLSMQNPLACLNTALLKAYSSYRPEVPILASIVKQWAKARNINDPSNHTLSSYGYILMILHFLTTHATTPQGLTTPSNNTNTIVPNLQFIHRPQSTAAGPFLQPHPLDPSFTVNTYYYKNTHPNTNLPNNSPSVGILLASFFRYYAYEFDYKKQVVSLHALSQLRQREVKAEYFGWKLYGPALCIEDPFETFYDVAHVLKPSTFYQIKQEFARAYSIIVDAATLTWETGGINTLTGEQLLQSICEPPAETNTSKNNNHHPNKNDNTTTNKQQE